MAIVCKISQPVQPQAQSVEYDQRSNHKSSTGPTQQAQPAHGAKTLNLQAQSVEEFSQPIEQDSNAKSQI